MTPWVLLLLGGAVVGTVGYGYLANRPTAEEPVALYPFELSAAEVQQARDLAEANSELNRGKTVFIKVDLLPDSRAGTGRRQVTVTHYRYEDDMTFYTHVDLKTTLVFGLDAREHVPTGLAEQEKARAVELARADRRLYPLFAEHGDRLRVELRPTRPLSERDPTYGHRLVLLAFVVDDRYLPGPTVVVDLTTEQVHVEKTAP
jgi:hypothetical protein